MAARITHFTARTPGLSAQNSANLKRMRCECRVSRWVNDQEQYALRQAIEAITSELEARTMRKWNFVILAVAMVTLVIGIMTYVATLGVAHEVTGRWC